MSGTPASYPLDPEFKSRQEVYRNLTGFEIVFTPSGKILG